MADMDVTAKFRADISDMKSKMDTISRDLSQMNTKAQSAGKGFTVLRGSIATAFGSAIVGGIAAGTRALSGFLQGAVDMAKESELTVARLDAIATSMGLMDTVLGGSTQRLLDQAQALQEVTGVSDETIKSAQALILTFQSVAATAGETGGIFDRTTAAAMDLSAAGFGDVESSAKSLARALEDPTRGLTMLSRQGVTFDKAQQDMIKGLVASGQTLEAQEMILAAVEKQVGGTAEAVAKDSDKMSAAFKDLQEGIGLALFPVLQELAATLTPIIKDLQGPLSEVAKVVAGALQKAFAELGPLIGPLATALAAIGQAITTALAGALEALIPALVPVAQNLTELANKIAPILAAVLSKVGEVLARILSAVTPLLGPLSNLIFSVLEAAMPILDIVADLMMSLVDALTPLLDAVLALTAPLIELVTVALAAIMPILQPIIPLFNALANVLSDVLVRAVGVLMVALGTLITGLSRVAGFVLRNFTRPIVTAFTELAKNVVTAAARMLSWVPGLGPKLAEAEKAVKDFADNAQGTMQNLAETAEREGTRIGSNLVTSGTQAIIQGTPGLANAAHRAGSTAARAFESGMDAHSRGLMLPAPKMPPIPLSPDPAPSASGSPSSAAAASKQENDRQARMEQFVANFERLVDRYNSSIEGMERALASMANATRRAFGELSQIQTAFTGSPSAVISMFDQMTAGLNELQHSLSDVAIFGRSNVRALRQNLNEARGYISNAAQHAINLMRDIARGREELAEAERAHAANIEGINAHYAALESAAKSHLEGVQAHYDGLIKAAQNNIKHLQRHFKNLEDSARDTIERIEERYRKMIPALEAALKETSKAYDRENKVLQQLIQQRDTFLGEIGSGFRSFVNSLRFETSKASKQLVRETKTLANGIVVTLEREIEVGGSSQGIAQALASRLQAVRDFTANIQTLIGRGLDPQFVAELVSAGVDGAGDVVSALAVASAQELAEINAVQADLASEVASFQNYATEQWHDAAIAAQQAILTPIETARDAAQMALDIANATRETDLAAAQAHLKTVLALRDQELEAANTQMEALQEARERDVNNAQAALDQIARDRGHAINVANNEFKRERDQRIRDIEAMETTLKDHADEVQNTFDDMGRRLPPKMLEHGWKFMGQFREGFTRRFPRVKSNLNARMDELVSSMRRPPVVLEIVTVHRSVFQGAGPDGQRAMGGPVMSNRAYLVGERGPEMLIMGSQSGNIIPNHELGVTPSMSGSSTRRSGNGASTVVNINVRTGIATDPAETGRQVVEAIRKYERRSGPVFVSA